MNDVPKPANGSRYTPAEIKEILDDAKRAGLTFLKVDGFEAVWEIERGERAPAAAPAREAHAQDEGHGRCACGDRLVPGNWGRPYCVACWQREKDRKGNGQGRGYRR